MKRTIGLGLLLAVLAAAMPAPVLAGGPPVVFQNPAGGTQYRSEGTLKIRWLERVDPSIVGRALIRQRGALDTNGGCGAARYIVQSTHAIPASAVGDPDGSGHRRVTADITGHQPNMCYRYRVRMDHADGSEVRSTVSSPFRTLRTWTGSFNLYRSSAFSTQRTNVWCIAAGVQMMRNLIKGESDHSSATQKRYYDDARANDRFENWRFPGSDAQGWAAALRTYTGVSHYAWHADTTYRDAIRSAARQIRRTGKPVGLMVSRGGHAWVMTGFRATADPAVTDDYEVTSVYIMGPLYPVQQSSSGYDRPPNTRFSYEWLKHFFVPFRSLPNENSEIWDQKFVSVTT